MQHILILEDETPFQELMIDLFKRLQPSDYHLTTASTYDEALLAIEQQTFAACLVDVNLGEDRTGLDFISESCEKYPKTAMILLTAVPNKEVDLAGMAAGAIDYLQKDELSSDKLERSLRYAIAHNNTLNELRTLYNQKAELEQLKTDMIRIAAHDLRNPVTAIFGSLELMQLYLDDIEFDDKTRKSLDKHLGQVKDGAQMIHRLVASILSLDHIEDLQQGEKQIINMSALAQQVYDECLPSAQRKSINVILHLPDETPHVAGDEAQLYEAMTNLVSNAVKYTPNEGTIDIGLKTNGNRVDFYVQDTGYGIPEAQQPRIFQPFFRARTEETAAIEGNGLGLYLVKNIIVRHNGEIHFESIYGEGSTFGFEIPKLVAIAH